MSSASAKIKKPGKKLGSRLKPKAVDPKVRAAKRLAQAERAVVPASVLGGDTARYAALLARIAKLKAGSWPGGAE